jgi:hypothetical protein
MTLADLFKLVEQTGLAAWVREDNFAFPVLEAVHVAAVMLVLGSIGMMDLRLLGWSSPRLRVTQISREALPWTWAAFAVAVVSGSLLMSGQAGAYAANLQFQIKMALLAAAGANMLVFHSFVWRQVGDWDLSTAPPPAARIAGGLSLALWIGVVVAGRWVGWTVSASPF